MSAQPDYAAWAVDFYKRALDDAERDKEIFEARVKAIIPLALRDRETWECGIAEAVTESPNTPSPIITAMMDGDWHRAGELIYDHVRFVKAREVAEIAVHRQDEDAANDFAIG